MVSPISGTKSTVERLNHHQSTRLVQSDIREYEATTSLSFSEVLGISTLALGDQYWANRSGLDPLTGSVRGPSTTFKTKRELGSSLWLVLLLVQILVQKHNIQVTMYSKVDLNHLFQSLCGLLPSIHPRVD